MAKSKKPKAVEFVTFRKGGSTANADQLRAVKTLTYVGEKQALGLADKDIRTILKGVHMPNANLAVHTARRGVTAADGDPRDPVTGADPIGPGQDGDPPFWRTDADPTDPAKRENRTPFA